METKRKHRYITWLIYGIVLTILLTTITLSRFNSSGSGNDSATVASIVTEQKEIKLKISNESLKPGKVVEYKFGITNTKTENDDIYISEVSQSYDIMLETTGNLPLKYQLIKDVDASGTNGTLAEGATEEKAITDANKKVQINTESGILPHSVEEEHYYILKVTWPSDKTHHKYATEIDAITIEFVAEQKD